MKKRIYGLETEYGITLVYKDGSWSSDEVALTPYQGAFRSILGKEFLPNGSRIYFDLSYHPEYCTAECVDLADLVAQDKAGEKILNRVFTQVVGSREEVRRIALFKSNSQYAARDDTTPITMGCHENFLIKEALRESDLAGALIPFLVARQIFAGSGWVTNPSYQTRGLRYAIAQRSRFIQQMVGDSTQGPGRSILCTARWSEPHANEAIYRRLHLILGDSNMSEISTYLKMGTLGILLEMLEEGYPLARLGQRFMPRYPVDALQSIALDLTCKKPTITLSDGRYMSPIDMLWEYVDMMDEYEKLQGLSPELSDVLKRLIDGLQRLEKRTIDEKTLMEIDSQGLDEEWDWLIKKSIHDAVLRSFDCHWNNFEGKLVDYEHGRMSVYEKLRSNDLRYHDIAPDGLYNDFAAEPDLPLARIKALGIRTPRIAEKEQINNMEENPPQNSRAKVRGDFVRFLESRNIPKRYFSIGWDIIHFIEGYPFLSVEMPDPFATNNGKIDWLKSAMEKKDILFRPAGQASPEHFV